MVSGGSGEVGNPGTLGMTKEGVVVASAFNAGEREISCLLPGDESYGLKKSTLCHPERSRGICSFSTGIECPRKARSPEAGRDLQLTSN